VYLARAPGEEVAKKFQKKTLADTAIIIMIKHSLAVR
jgi:hypothetical protein